jgi:metallo-beta-lactamase family protein
VAQPELGAVQPGPGHPGRRDCAHLQEEDATHARQHGYSRHHPPLALYGPADAERAIGALQAQPYGQPVTLGGGGQTTFSRAGHILGSASALVALGGSRVLFSGDLGRPTHSVLLPREDPPAADTVVIESTYGELMEAGEIPDVPVYVDSPMALASLDVYRRPELRSELRPGLPEQALRPPRLRAARAVEESMRLNHPEVPCVIVSASGMASGGRVVHHLRQLKMHGYYVPVRAEVVVDHGFSVHAPPGREGPGRPVSR